MTAKELISAVKAARQDLDAARSSKRVADDGLTNVQAAISDAEEFSTFSQKRKADAQSTLNRALAYPQSTVEEIQLLRKSLKAAEKQQGDAVDSINAAKRDLKKAGRAVAAAADAVVEVERNYWRTVWMREAHNAREAAAEHLKRAWAAALASDFEPGQFDSLLKRTFTEPDEGECKALAETMR